MSEPLAEMIEALGLEVAAIRRKGGSTQIELHGGERIGQTGGAWLYGFFVAEDLNLRDDTPVRVTVGQTEVRGVVASFRDGVLTVALEVDLGPTIASAHLVADAAFLLERLVDRLEELRSGEAQCNRGAAERVLGLSPIRTGEAQPHPLVRKGTVPGDRSPNEDQLSAVRRSLGSNTLFIWGPPGTGKTTTLARIVEAHYRCGRSVLLVSNTNIAVDTALEKVAERLEDEPDFQQGLVIRQGPVVKVELRQRFGLQVALDEVVARLSGPLEQEKRELEREAEALSAEGAALVAAAALLTRLEGACERLAAREKALSAARLEAAAREREAQHHHQAARELRAKIERARTMGLVRRLFAGLNPERLAQQAEEADRAAEGALHAAGLLAEEQAGCEDEIRVLRSEVDVLSAAVQECSGAENARARLAVVRSRLEAIRARVADIERELALLEEQVIARCRVLATTVYRTYLGKRPSRQFDVVIVDEASMLMPPLVYYAAGLARECVTVAGDFRQLPPIVLSDDPLAEEWLKRDVFEKSGIVEQVKQRRVPQHLVTLQVQYRMREEICELINDLFYYDRPLTSDPTTRRGDDGFPFSQQPLLFIDTASLHPWAALRVGTYSRYNIFHALLVRNVVLRLAQEDFLPPAEEVNDRVGVVAPYAAQARLIQALLWDRLGPRAAGIAATVHRFQGNERSAMVLDLTDSLGVRLGHFLRARGVEEDGARLLNVAASRARQHVVLIGNFEYLLEKAPRDGIVHRMVRRFVERGTALDVHGLLPLADPDWVDGLRSLLPTTFEFSEGGAEAFNEGTFRTAFRSDVAHARQSIVIVSPFATTSGTARWIDALRVALERGVHVRVITRPPRGFRGGTTDEAWEVVTGLRALGVSVDLRSRMHEKIAIVDGRVLWLGSLNILSHRDTHESILRIESQAACQQVGRFISSPTSYGDDPTLWVPGNPPCPACGSPTIWNDGRYGVWFECERPDCHGKADARRAETRRREVRRRPR